MRTHRFQRHTETKFKEECGYGASNAPNGVAANRVAVGGGGGGWLVPLAAWQIYRFGRPLKLGHWLAALHALHYSSFVLAGCT